MKLDLGCGKRKTEGFIGVDSILFDNIDLVCDLSKPTWVFKPGKTGAVTLSGNEDFQFSAANAGFILKDNSIDEAFASHFVEHLTGAQRIGFFNELHRVLKPGSAARIITPHWSHERAYGDPTHQWPPVCAWTYFYLEKSWREGDGTPANPGNAPHVGYTCDFSYVLVGTHDPNDAWVAFRNPETKAVFMSRNINTVTDLIATITKKIPPAAAPPS